MGDLSASAFSCCSATMGDIAVALQNSAKALVRRRQRLRSRGFGELFDGGFDQFRCPDSERLRLESCACSLDANAEAGTAFKQGE